MERSTAETLVKVYAVLVWFSALWIVIGALAVLFLGSVIGGMMGGTLTMLLPTMDEMMLGNALAAGGLVGLGMIILALILAALAVVFVLIGRAIWRKERWGRIAALVVSALSIFNFPLGTIMGAFGIWLFGFEPQVQSLFGASAPRKAARKGKSSRKKKR